MEARCSPAAWGENRTSIVQLSSAISIAPQLDPLVPNAPAPGPSKLVPNSDTGVPVGWVTVSVFSLFIHWVVVGKTSGAGEATSSSPRPPAPPGAAIPV